MRKFSFSFALSTQNPIPHSKSVHCQDISKMTENGFLNGKGEDIMPQGLTEWKIWQKEFNKLLKTGKQVRGHWIHRYEKCKSE